MENNKKMICLCLVLTLAFACLLAGCFQAKDRILAAESYTCEYGESYAVPFVTNIAGREATVEIFDADGFEVMIEYGVCTLEKGEYTMVFTVGQLKKEVPLYCVDTTGPKISITYTSSVAVGHWFTLPSANATDSGVVDKDMTKVALYKAGEDTPVLTTPGERIKIENVAYYTLKATAADMDGNIGYFEEQIEVIVRPESEVLQDFSEEVDPYWENTWGGGEPAFQWLAEFEGRQGVIAMGVDGAAYESGYGYAWWTDLGMDDLNLVGATGFTIKLRAQNCRMLSIKPGFSDSTIGVYGSHTFGIPYKQDEWVEVYVSLVNAGSLFSDMSKATVAFCIAPESGQNDICVWIDEVIVHYTPYEEYTVTVNDGTIDYKYDTVSAGRKVTVTHDASKTPVGKVFSHYLCNGKRIWGNRVTITEDSVLTPVYVDLVTEEKAIPEGAVLVTDFSTKSRYSASRSNCITEWYATYEGVAGVLSIGLTEHNGYVLPDWTGILPLAFNFDPYTHVTFRMMVRKDAVEALGIVVEGAIVTDLLGYVPDGNMTWVDVKIPVSQLKSLSIGLTNVVGTSGEMVWFDQIFATAE